MTTTCPRCGASQVAGSRYCSNCGQPLPAPVRPAERRQISVMFCDLVGSLGLSNMLDPEDLRDIVRRYQHIATGVVERHEGHVAQYLGDGILTYFGYPVAHEGEAERAVRAGLEIIKEMSSLSRDVLAEFNVELAVRIGLHTGLVVVGEVGGGARRENLALGETPNVAARLQSLAPHNGLAISQSTHRLVSGAFDVVDLGIRAIKGLDREERVYLVKEERMTASPLDLFGERGPFSKSGREDEVEAVQQCWRHVVEGRGRILVVSGEPGIGKSHVVQLFRQELAAVPHFRVECRCSQHLRSSALHPIIDWLSRVLNFYPDQPTADQLDMIEFVAERNELPIGQTVPLLASLLSIPTDDRYLDPGFSPALKRERTEQVLIDLMLKIRADRPLVVIVEDLHWTDPSTRALLHRFAASIREQPILLLITTRRNKEFDWPEDVPVESLHLSRLNREKVEALIAEVSGDKPLPPSVVEQIIEKTDGVPLFVQELVRMVIESDLVVELDDCFKLGASLPDLAIPSTLQDSLMARLDRLLPLKEVAQLCSVVGREFSHALAAAVSPVEDDALIAALARLVDAGILLSEGTPPNSRYIFRHALIQETAYASLLKSRRQQAHRRIADYLTENDGPDHVRPEILAHHLTRAGARDEAARYWCRAGQEAHSRWANEEALDYFSRGRALLDGLPETAERQQLRFFLNAGLAVSSLQIRGYTHPSVLTAFENAAALADLVGDASASVPILRGMWAHYTVLSDHRRAEDLARQLITLASGTDDTLMRMEAELTSASTAFWRGRVVEANDLYQEAIARYDGADKLAPPNLAVQHPVVNALSYLSLARWYLGYPEQALQRSREAIDVADRIDHPFSRSLALIFRSVLCSYLGDLDETRDNAQRAIEISSRFGFPFWLAIGTVMRAWASAGEDREAATTSMKQGLGALQSAGARIWTAYPGALLAELLVERDQSEEALRLIDDVVKQAESSDENYFLPEILRIRAKLFATLGRTDEAEMALERALALAREQRARPLVLHILADILRGEPEPSDTLRQLLQKTLESYEERPGARELLAVEPFLTG